MILVETNFGNFKIELDKDKVPETCRNFLDYVKEGFYDDTIFHRVIDGFMIQGGGLTEEMEKKDTNPPIKNEADKSESHKRGTVAMARTSDPHSATAQFFINVKDNDFLNFRSKDLEGWGYCVFGKVVEGMDIVDKISKVTTTTQKGHNDVPEEPVKIIKISQED